jgi:hypothetical protein
MDNSHLEVEDSIFARISRVIKRRVRAASIFFFIAIVGGFLAFPLWPAQYCTETHLVLLPAAASSSSDLAPLDPTTLPVLLQSDAVLEETARLAGLFPHDFQCDIRTGKSPSELILYVFASDPIHTLEVSYAWPNAINNWRRREETFLLSNKNVALKQQRDRLQEHLSLLLANQKKRDMQDSTTAKDHYTVKSRSLELRVMKDCILNLKRRISQTAATVHRRDIISNDKFKELTWKIRSLMQERQKLLTRYQPAHLRVKEMDAAIAELVDEQKRESKWIEHRIEEPNPIRARLQERLETAEIDYRRLEMEETWGLKVKNKAPDKSHADAMTNINQSRILALQNEIDMMEQEIRRNERFISTKSRDFEVISGQGKVARTAPLYPRDIFLLLFSSLGLSIGGVVLLDLFDNRIHEASTAARIIHAEYALEISEKQTVQRNSLLQFIQRIAESPSDIILMQDTEKSYLLAESIVLFFNQHGINAWISDTSGAITSSIKQIPKKDKEVLPEMTEADESGVWSNPEITVIILAEYGRTTRSSLFSMKYTLSLFFVIPKILIIHDVPDSYSRMTCGFPEKHHENGNADENARTMECSAFYDDERRFDHK